MKTATTAILPIVPFDFESHEVRVITIDSNPWFCLRDMCDVLELDKNRPVSRFRFNNEGVAQYATPSAGGTQSMFYINEGNVFRLIARSKKPQAILFERWIFDEVLPAIRKHGRYEDANNKMATLIDQTIGTDGFHILQDLIIKKTKVLPIGVQRQAKSKLWSVLHTRFNVPRADLIPADDMDSACNFVAAYALEGEYLAGIQGDDHITINLPKAPGDEFDKLPVVRMYGYDVGCCSKLSEMLCLLRNAAKNDQYVRVMDIGAAELEVSGLRHHLEMTSSALQDIGRQTSNALNFTLRRMF